VWIGWGSCGFHFVEELETDVPSSPDKSSCRVPSEPGEDTIDLYVLMPIVEGSWQMLYQFQLEVT
jgi:hypothetical protein